MLIEWKSEKRRNPFAPQWNIPFWYEKIFEEDECEDIAQSVLRREKEIIEQFRNVTNDGGTGLGPQSLTAKFSQFSVWGLRLEKHQASRHRIHFGLLPSGVVSIEPLKEGVSMEYHRWRSVNFLIDRG